MHLINIPQMQQVVEHVVVGENEPCWFHGEPGCGKSQGIAGAVARLGAQLIDFRLGQYDTVDFKGFPDIDRETNTTVWYMASTLPISCSRSGASASTWSSPTRSSARPATAPRTAVLAARARRR